MRSKLVIVCMMMTLFGGAVIAISSSANFKITTEVLDSGSINGSSASFKMLAKTRSYQVGGVASSNFIFGAGFLKGAYLFVKPPILAPVVTAITPSGGLNTGPVNITDLAGANFSAGADVRLLKSGQTDIIASNVAVVSSSKITGTFNITGADVGLWDVKVANTDGQAGTLPAAFKIEAPTVQIIGPVQSTKQPFNPEVEATAITYTLSKDTTVDVDIFNIRGERVWHWTSPAGVSGGAAGANAVAWDGITAFKGKVASGVYIVNITTKVDGNIVTLGKTKIAVIK